MKAVVVTEFGGPEVMKVVESNPGEPGNGQVLIAVKAIGVNPVETYIRAGTYPTLPDLPYTPGGNVAGIIAACGPGVSSLKVGARVYSVATVTGAYAEMSICNVSDVFSLPSTLSFSQGNALGVPAATAWRGLFIRGNGQKGERLLIHGASGSVGQAAVQLANGAGCEVWGTAGSKDGCALVTQLGGRAFNHNVAGYDKELLQDTSGKGFDLILEMLANKNLEMDLDLLAPGGRVVIIGSRGRIEIDPRATMGKETDIRGLALFSATREEMQETHRALAGAMAEGILSPTVSRELKLSEAPAAHERVMQDGNNGKIVLIP
ncbi:MAG: quinone oxidoreductase [Desulfotalea sp.]|nr:MAG: quinone oxidoreductase [Desulfotalea sp.]